MFDCASRSPRLLLAAAVVLVSTASGCGLIFGGDQRVDNKSHDYDVLRLDREEPRQWRFAPSADSAQRADEGEPLMTETGDIAFEQISTGSIISVNSVCREYRQETLAELSRNLTLGLPIESQQSSREIEIDGVPAFENTFSARLGEKNNLMKIRTVVLRKSSCTFDLMYIARPEHFDRFAGDFERFQKGFHVP